MNSQIIKKQERLNQVDEYLNQLSLNQINQNQRSAISSKIAKRQQMIFCQYCKNKLKQTQYNSHFGLCKKKAENQRQRNQTLNKLNDNKRQSISNNQKQQKYNYFGSQQHKEAEQKRKASKQIFQQLKQQVNQSKLKPKEIQKQQKKQSYVEQAILCPFCSKFLSLNDLDHIQICNSVGPCEYCGQSYPIQLLSQHIQNCERKIASIVQDFEQQQQQKKRVQVQKKERERKIQPNQDHLKEFASIMAKLAQNKINQRLQEQRMKIYQEQMRNKPRYMIPGRNIRRQQSYYDPRYYDEQSQLKQKEGLSHDQIDELGVDIYMKKNKKEDEDCNVCMIAFKQEDQVIRLPCFHVFHQECIVPWLEIKAWCPTCKGKVQL